MGIDVIASMLGALASLLAGGLASSEPIQKAVRHLLGTRETPAKPYGERLAELTASLLKASREVDTVLGELAQVARSREAAVRKLETDLGSLERKELELKSKIEALERTPLPSPNTLRS